MTDENRKTDRRGFLGDGARVAGAIGLTGLGGFMLGRKGRDNDLLWQIDPDKCIACKNCQIHCVLDTSAVKAVQCFALCGYCDICTGYLVEKYVSLDSGAEVELCPTGAVKREFVEAQGGNRYFKYTIGENECVGCGKCVKGCAGMNGSLYLQVRHDRCLNCNECSIAVACPTQAFCRVPPETPLLLKRLARDASENRLHKLERDLTRDLPQKRAEEMARVKRELQEMLARDARGFLEGKVQRG